MTDAESYFQNIAHPARFREAVRQFDHLNSQDPHQEQNHPREVLNAQRLCAWIMKLDPAASEELRLAARCQHLCRWEIPRASYPATRAGYHQWKNDLKRFHAARSAEVLRAIGYPEAAVQKVSDLNLKKNFPADPQVRTLEDSLCLVFLEHQLGELAAKLDDEKTINAIRKSWEKMTDAAREHALSLPYTERERALLENALRPA